MLWDEALPFEEGDLGRRCRGFPACVAAFCPAGGVRACFALAPRTIRICTCSRFAACVQIYTHIVGL